MRRIVNFMLLFFVLFSCETKKNDEQNIKAVVVKDTVFTKDSNLDETKAPDCISRLIDVVQSNSECQFLIENMKKQNIKYAFQIDSIRAISRTYPEDSLTYYRLTLVEHHPTHNRNAAQFSFSPYFKQLYIMDAVKAKFVKTDCDIKLIDIYKKNCRK